MSTKEDKRAFWVEAIDESRRSGQRIVEWCRCRGLSTKTYYYWYKVLANEGRIQKEALPKNRQTYELIPGESSPTAVFAEVDLHHLEQTFSPETGSVQQYKADVFASQIILEKGGCFVHIGTDFNADTLKRVMEVL